jgi:dihydrofolate reductase
MGNLVANINIIVAASENNCIGKNNDLPWKLPTDLKRFKELTTGHIVVMGRKCWESIPEKFRPLPNRTNVVITRNSEYVADGAEVRNNLLEALNEFAYGSDEVFVIGGAEIYKEAFPYANKLYLTRVMAEVDGDVFLEGLVPEEWVIKAFDGPYEEDELKYRFDTYEKKK